MSVFLQSHSFSLFISSNPPTPHHRLLQRTCTQYEAPMPSPPHHTLAHMPLAGPALMFPSALGSSPLHVMFPPAGVTHERPLLRPPHSLWFDLEFHENRMSSPFYISFSCAADVLKRDKRQPGSGESGSKSLSSSSFLFMLTCMSSLPLCCIAKVTATSGYRGAKGPLSLEVCGQWPSPLRRLHVSLMSSVEIT